ncbi:MAG TPA: hypothetical protein VFQ11_12710 [Nocardioidaceae bacterium]|nr:hypothetical protein [Nocardioidaceae bacterium]
MAQHAGRRRRAGAAAAAGLVVLLAAAVVVLRGSSTPGRTVGKQPPSPPAAAPSPSPSARLPVADDLLDRTQVRRLAASRRWTVTSGAGLSNGCQERRSADPRGHAALVRTFRAAGNPARSAMQTVEVSRSVSQAHRAYRTTLGWYAGCRAARVQLLDAYRVDRIGDEAQVLVLRRSVRPAGLLSVALARTGSVVTSTVGTTVGASSLRVRRVVATLEVAVRNLCARSVAGRCAGRAAFHAVPPPPAGRGEEAGILAVVDLPPVGRVGRRWVGTRPAPTQTDPSVSTCDRADLRAAGAIRTRSRTYLVPGAGLPDRFGLAEAYGVFRSSKAAGGFLSSVRTDLATCAKRDASTEVGRERRSTSARADASQWLLTTKVSSTRKVRFRVGFVRVGRSVAQLRFAPTPGADVSESVFASLLDRAGDRLRELH